MQTLEFTRALKEIVAKMRVDELISTLGKWLTPVAGQNPPLTDKDKSLFSDLVFGSYAGYASLANSERTRRILDGVDAKDFYDPDRLRILVSSISSFSQIGQVRGLAEAHAFFEKLRSLQKIATTCQTLLETEKVGEVGPGEGIVELELVDYDGKGIEPERLRLLASIVRQLHTNLARIHGIEGDQLRFRYFDSGSPVLMGIQCAKEIAESINKAMLEWWDKIRFAPFDKFDKRMEVMSKGLTVMETVKQKVESRVIDEETGRILARHVLKEVDKLVGIGATVPLEDRATVDQRELLLAKRDVKLLEGGQPGGAEEDNTDGTRQEPPAAS